MATPGSDAAVREKRLTAAELAHRNKRIWTMRRFEMSWEDICAVEHVSQRTAQRAAKEWQEYLDRGGTDAPYRVELLARMRPDGTIGFGGAEVGVPLDEEEREFEEQLRRDREEARKNNRPGVWRLGDGAW